MNPPMTPGEVRAWLAGMVPKHDPTADAISDHFSGDDFDEFDAYDCEPPEPITGPMSIYEHLPIVHPAARVASILSESERLLARDDDRVEQVKQVVQDSVASKQWTSDMPWRTEGRMIRIGDLDDRHLANAVRYCQRKSMWRSMAALMIEKERRMRGVTD